MNSRVPATEALLVVDPQVDFCPGGALAVPGGDAIFRAVNRAAEFFYLVVASRDWHPADHVSFAAQGGIWPMHCVAGTPGAQFHHLLDTKLVDHVVSKGTIAGHEAYSAFAGTGLGSWLRERGVSHLYVAGLATDYCVRESVLDALGEGLAVSVITDAIGAVDVHPGDGQRALSEMAAAGAELIESGQLARV